MLHLDMTGRQVEITPALREFAEEKLSKLERLLDGPLEIHVVLGIEKHRHSAEIQVKSKTAIFSGHVVTGDLYASIGEVADKLERQALRHKEKLHDHKHRKGPRDPEIAATIEANASSSEETADGEPAERSAPRIVRTQRSRLKPMSPEEAAHELEASGEELLVFRDSETERVNVVYKQGDGNFGLVDTEF